MSGLTIVVAGMVAADPHQGGASWAVLQYVLALRALGHRPILVETLPPAPPSRRSPLDRSSSGRYFRSVVEAIGLDEAALLDPSSGESVGMPYRRVLALADEADLLLDIAGTLADEDILGRPGRRAYIDVDPAFTQLWATQGIDMRLDGHDRHVTVGLNVGRPGCDVPTCGVDWIRMPPVVHLPAWEPQESLERDAFTTVGNWRGYGAIEHGGLHYGQRAHSMRGLAALASTADARFEMALALHPGEVDDLKMLRDNGWILLDPAVVASTPERYRGFVRGSKAELGVAKSGYVVSRSGWFSDRSACYLAAGRPVVAQDTGFGDALPVGEGLLAYEGVEDAAEAVRAVTLDYEHHRRAARGVAEEHLSGAVVLPVLLDQLQ